MRICILSIGSELLEGSVVDTNSAFIGSELAHYGVSPDMIRMVKDNRQEIVSLFSELSKEFDIILTTGGLGPTFDDITAECLAISCQSELILNERAYNHMKEMLERSGVKLRKEHEHQVMLPKDCLLFNNVKGTALGFSMHLNKADIICMPGVPVEMKAMFSDEVIPYLREKYSFKEITYKDMHFLSVPESEVDAVIRSIEISSDTQCIINAGSGKVVVKLRGYNNPEIKKVSDKLKSVFKESYLGDNYTDEAKMIIDILKSQNKTISFAESCTGGLLSEYITNVSGASEVFMGSVVSYDNSVKHNVLNVPDDILMNYGAVSEECAAFMASGVKKLMKTNYAVSITGIAGPNGGSEEKPVGLVYIGIAKEEEIKVYKNIFNGDRQQVRMKSAKKAMLYLLNLLKEY
ncbi:MAG: CinA family nicotinamide mononucleotide deamidase-related protein [Candidatus Mucispirillum faecigallinarum]|nr:CinA family nicotinamide mononucleotide deamidase-related protein [Candidatus Mucispirillum faecigallinarum]